VIGREQREHGAIGLEKIHEKTHRLLLHVGAQPDDGGKMPLALFIERLHIAHVQPLAAKLGREPVREAAENQRKSSQRFAS